MPIDLLAAEELKEGPIDLLAGTEEPKPKMVGGGGTPQSWLSKLADYPYRAGVAIAEDIPKTAEGIAEAGKALLPSKKYPLPGLEVAVNLGAVGAGALIPPSLVKYMPEKIQQGREVFKETVARPVAEAIKDPLAVPGKLLERVKERPVQTALDVAAIGSPAKRILGMARGVAEKAVFGGGLQGIQNIGKSAGLSGAELTSVENNIRAAAKEGFFGTIKAKMETRPRTISDINKYVDSAANTIADQVMNKDQLRFINAKGEEITGRTPKTLWEMGQTAEQRKKDVGAQIGTAIESANIRGAGAGVDSLVEDLHHIENSLTAQRGGTDKYAKQLAEFYRGRDTLSIKDIQNEITDLTARTKGSGVLPANDVSKANIDRVILKHMRQMEEAAIESIQEPSLKPLKDLYRDYKTTEKDVTNRIAQELRRKGMAPNEVSDLVSKYTLGELAFGLATGHWLAVAKGGTFGLANILLDYLRRPDAKIEKMYQRVQDAFSRVEREGKLKRAGKFTAKTAGPVSTAGDITQTVDEKLEDKMKRWLEIGPK